MDAKTEALAWLAGQREAMTALLGRLVDIDSGSRDQAGVARVGQAIRETLETAGIPVEEHPLEAAAPGLTASVAGTGGSGGANRYALLMGHRDTVFGEGEAVRRPFTVEGDLGFGPGVADMKAGLVMNTFVLLALQRAGGAPVPVVALYTSDEEIASPASRPLIESVADGALAVFNAEPGRESGNVVTGRKGVGMLGLEVAGRASHAGGAHEAGASAIEALARKIRALHSLTDYERGITVNVGVIAGGTTVNTVAPWATAEVDLRFVDPVQRAELRAAVEAIVAHEELPGTSARIVSERSFPPMTQSAASARLFERYAAAAAEVGFVPEGEFSGGGSDAGFTAGRGVPTLCGAGPVGGKFHTEEEWCRLDTLVPRAQAVAAAIFRMER